MGWVCLCVYVFMRMYVLEFTVTMSFKPEIVCVEPILFFHTIFNDIRAMLVDKIKYFF